MKYNEKYDRWVSKEGVVLKYNEYKDKLTVCTEYERCGYIRVFTKLGKISAHRVIYETFVGSIPDGFEIDHINTIRSDNRLENLRCVTHKENCSNPISKNKQINALRGRIFSEFGRKFKEHYGITRYQNLKLYEKEKSWYHTHNHKCRWE